MPRIDGPRIALLHAFPESIEPIHAAFAALWPRAITFDLLDSSLSADLTRAGEMTPAIVDRVVALARYAESCSGQGGTTAAVLVTCAALGPAIDAVKRAVKIPVVRPNEATFEDAVTLGGRVGLLVSFPPSLAALRADLDAMARQRGVSVEVDARVVKGALDALKRGDGHTHDYLVTEAAAQMPVTNSLVLGQFSLARAAAPIEQMTGRPVLTTPESAVLKLRELCAQSGQHAV
ncbi:aspartate/glutamate racemase family protein [Peristeroidobacter soli]|jgi:Asp/Glu/hydantoin racemase|uniref:aspartate/glutamate racemase family protein n=1 Tax=Peristeroidobacter soli TaxID=2497877 RepID=UPI00101CD6F7|nr:aspartate/glutamate racemase family protein [Peristeroidobacter soli]